MNKSSVRLSVLCSLCALWLALPASAEPAFITLASTTSTENSGLLAELIPKFRARSGIDVHVVAVGTGRALEIAQRGDADVLLVHDRLSEDLFVSEGWGIERRDVMYNDFVLVGPLADPAGVRGGRDLAGALSRIATGSLPFVSRGDDSGTHKAELRLWHESGLDPVVHSGTWYRETGSGMGATLNTAAAMGAYTIADRGSWLAFRNKQGLVITVEGDPRLLNPYGVILVNPARHPHVKASAARAFADWLVSPEGQASIAAFRVAGEPLFHPSFQPNPGNASGEAEAVQRGPGP